MVNLPKAGTSLLNRAYHWSPNFGWRKREEIVSSDPSSLRELEALAKQSVQLMEKHGTKTNDSYNYVMELLREEYNMNFLIQCDECRGTHSQDELVAPER